MDRGKGERTTGGLPKYGLTEVIFSICNSIVLKTNYQSNMLTEKEGRRHNRRFANKHIQWLVEHFTSHQIFGMLTV
jgi:hypothetical protein